MKYEWYKNWETIWRSFYQYDHRKWITRQTQINLTFSFQSGVLSFDEQLKRLERLDDNNNYFFFESVKMNSSKKSTIENPRRGANLLSQLFFVWTVPLLWKGMKNGLSSKDLTKCLEKFKSEALADNLER